MFCHNTKTCASLCILSDGLGCRCVVVHVRAGVRFNPTNTTYYKLLNDGDDGTNGWRCYKLRVSNWTVNTTEDARYSADLLSNKKLPMLRRTLNA